MIPRRDFWSVELSKGASPTGTAPSQVLRGLFCAKGHSQALGREDAHIVTALGFVRLKPQLCVCFPLRQDGDEGLPGGGGAWRAQKFSIGSVKVLLIWFWVPSPSQSSSENQQLCNLVLGSQSSTLTLLFNSRAFLLPKEFQQLCSGEVNSWCQGGKLKSSWDLGLLCQPPPAFQE